MKVLLNNSENKTAENSTGKRKSKKGMIASAVTLALAVCLFGLCFFVSSLHSIYPKVHLDGISLGGLSSSEAGELLQSEDYGSLKNQKVVVNLPGEHAVEIGFAEAGGDVMDYDQAVELAYNYGRNGNFFTNAFTYMKSLLTSPKVTGLTEVDADEVAALVSAAAEQLAIEENEPPYEIAGDNIIITKSVGHIDVPALTALVNEAFLKRDFTPIQYTPEPAEDINLAAVHEKVYVEPKNAACDPQTGDVTSHVVGVSFDSELATSLLSQAGAGESVTVPLIYTQPKIVASDLSGNLFQNLLGSKTTSFSGSSSSRINNIQLSAASINGRILNPGDEFSFNNVVGERTTARGYKSAGAYSGGQVVNEVGGGICQTSTTLYNAVLYANLDIVYRTNHYFSVSYVDYGFDATVNWGGPDFKFKNSSDYPIKLKAYISGTNLTIELYGTKQNDNYVKLRSTVVNYIPYNTIQQTDSSLSEGQTSVKTSGTTGCVSDAYQAVYSKDGTLIKEVYLGRDTYAKQDRVVLVPPAGKGNTSAPSTNPESDPAPDPIPSTDPGSTSEQ